MTGIHRAAAEGFARSAEAYERGRPGYPDAALRFALAPLGPEPLVLDLAAGTGKLTRPLLGLGARVIAVEPLAEMRAALPEAARVLEGTAEAIPLEDEAVDAVLVGQAFHWFDGDAALTEIARVLRPAGLLALLWNRRGRDDPVNEAIERIVGRHRGDTPAHRSGAWRGAFERTALFGPLEEHTFPNEHLLDAEGLADRVGSISFIASLPASERDQAVSAARALAAAGPVKVPVETELHVCRLR